MRSSVLILVIIATSLMLCAANQSVASIDYVKNNNLKLMNEIEDMIAEQAAATAVATAAATASVEMMIANQAAAVAAAASVSEKKYKRLRDENTALRDELAALKVPSSRSTSIVDEDAVMLLVTKMLEKHKRNSRSLEARVDAIETTQVTAWNDDDPSNGDQLTTHLTKRRHLSAVDSSVLEDAALWMQAKNAKILFGANADANLYRSAEEEITTDSNVVVKQDLTVLGENLHLTTMLTAHENVTIGGVISLCGGGEACVGYGLAAVGFKATNNKATDIKTIFLGGVDALTVMYYREWTGSSHQSAPKMRLIRPLSSTTKDYSTAPRAGDERAIANTDDERANLKCSELKMARITDTTMIIAYRKAGDTSSTNIAGVVRFAEIDSIGDGTFTVADEVSVPLVDGFGYKRGIPIRLGTTKFAIAFEHTDTDISGQWLGTGSISMGEIGGGSSGNRGLSIGGPVEFGKYVSDLAAVAFNDDQHIVLVYREQNALKTQDRGVAVLIDARTSLLSVVTTVVFNSVQTRFMDITMISKKALCVVYREPKQNFIAKGLLLDLIQTDTQLLASTPVPVADESSIDNSYALSLSTVRQGQLVLAYRNGAGRPRVVDVDVVGTTIVVGTPRTFSVQDHVADSYGVVGLTENAFMLVYQDNEANIPNAATAVLELTHGGALRTGVATSAGSIGEKVQVAVEGIVTIPDSTIKINGAGVSMTPGARYYARYDGGISPSSNDGVLLGRALGSTLLLLERDFAGGFRVDTSGTSSSSEFSGEIKALAGTTIPAGWLVCNGAAIDRIDFSSLFAAIGTTWGVGDNLATFNIPDLRGRTVVGVGKGGEGNNAHPSVTSAESAQAKATQHDLGDYDGSETFVYSPSYFDTAAYYPNRKYCITYENQADNKWCKPSYALAKSTWTDRTVTAMGEYIEPSLTTENNVNEINMMPYAALNYIIKT